MPIGIMLDAVCYVVGSLIGAAIGKYVPKHISKNLLLVLGYATLALGISLITKAKALPPVIFSVTIGTLIGELLDIEGHIIRFLRKAGGSVLKNNSSGMSDDKYIDQFITMLMVFVMGATGMLGALTEGMTGDSSVMMSKAVIDLLASATFATTMGFFSVSIVIPQLLLFIPLFFLAEFIAPIADAAMIGNFSACGGVIMIMTGMKVCEIKQMRITNTLPAFILAMPVTWLWNLVF